MISAIREAGPRALLLQLQSLDDVLACHQQLTSAPFRGQVDAVAAARTVLLRFSSRPALREARQHLDDLEFPAFSAEGARHVELEVIYDGEDLEELAAHLGMSTEALITWHSGQAWTGAFGGFAPGFTYCVPSHNDDDAAESADPAAAALDVPRRSSPRKAVPAGAVALAGEFSAVYPRVSPGAGSSSDTPRPSSGTLSGKPGESLPRWCAPAIPSVTRRFRDGPPRPRRPRTPPRPRPSPPRQRLSLPHRRPCSTWSTPDCRR